MSRTPQHGTGLRDAREVRNAREIRDARAPHGSPAVFMMDLLATVPYYTAYLSRALLALGERVRVGSISYYLDPACFRSRGLRLQPGCLDVVGRSPQLPRRLRRAGKLLETVVNHLALLLQFLVRPPDVLHVQYLPMLRSRLPIDLWFVQLVQRRGAKVVLTVHDLLPHDTADRFRRKFTGLYEMADQLICHSGHIRQRLREEFEVDESRIHVIPHGPFFYDLPESGPALPEGIPAGTPIVLWQGILFPYKGLDLLLDAWQEVEAQTTGATLMVMGTGAPELLAQIQEQVRSLGLRRVVLDLRFTSTGELVGAYRAASVVVYPYRAITTSGALATGLSLGRAIVASDLPVFRELLTDEVDALLVKPGDKEMLAGAVVRLLHDPELRTRLEHAVRSKNFGAATWKTIAEQTAAVYDAALAPHAGAHRRNSRP